MSQKKMKFNIKFNIIDVIVLVILAAAIVFVGVKMTQSSGTTSTTVPIRYTVLAENQPAAIADSLAQYVPGQLMASGSLAPLEIVSYEATPTILIDNGVTVKDPSHVDITLVVEGTIQRDAVLTASAGNQEIRIGRSIILKTEYIEFPTAVVVNVEYPESLD